MWGVISFWWISACAWKCSCCQKILSKNPCMTRQSKRDFYLFILFCYSSLSFMDNSHQQNRNPMTCHTSAHTLLMSPLCRQHLASSFLSLWIYFCGRGGGRIHHSSSYRMRRGASHIPLSAPLRGIFLPVCKRVNLVNGPYISSADGRPSLWDVSHAFVLELFCSLSAFCRPARLHSEEKYKKTTHNSNTHMHNRRHALELIT